MSEVEAKVKELVTKSLKLPEDKVQLESSFVDDLQADSLDIVELVMALEDEFGIEIPDKDAQAIKTVQDAVTYIQNNKS